MSPRVKTTLVTVIAALALVSGILITSFSRSPLATSVAYSTDEVSTLFGGSSIGFGAPPKFPSADVLTNWGALKSSMQTLFKRKHHLVSTNAGLAELAVALANYSHTAVTIPDVPSDLAQLYAFAQFKIGPYDSDELTGRNSAARAVVRLFDQTGWLVLHTSDQQLVIVSRTNYSNLLSAPLPHRRAQRETSQHQRQIK
jgi:hypothetical protein